MRRCEALQYDAASVRELWDAFWRWLAHPRFVADFNPLQCAVLNALQSTQSDAGLKEEGWAVIVELARQWKREDNETMMEVLRIANLEVVAEPPEVAEPLGKLFSMAGDPEVRWAVFAAYENFPWRLRPHALKYSKGTITDDDCDKWLITQGLFEDEILMVRPRSDDDSYLTYFRSR